MEQFQRTLLAGEEEQSFLGAARERQGSPMPIFGGN